MKILVTAGPTREPIDPVRFISNRSSGKMGYAIARAALEQGHTVVLVSGPVSLEAPPGAEVVRVQTAQEMCDAVLALFPACDAIIMVAAVADWRPRHASAQKLKKTSMSAVLELERTPDILEQLAPLKGGRLVIGFAAETADVEDEAVRKLRRKGLDGIVANDVSSSQWGMDSDYNKVILLGRDGSRLELPRLTKDETARRILAWMPACR